MSSLLSAALLLLASVSPAVAARFYVDASATGGADTGEDWANAFTHLQDGIDACAAAGGGEVWVAAGRYIPSMSNCFWANDDPNIHPTDTKAYSYHLANGVAIYGGFEGTEDELSERDWEARQTILCGDLDQEDQWQTGVPVVEELTATYNPPPTGDPTTDLPLTHNADNRYHVIYNSDLFHPVDSTAVLDGFIVTGGNANSNYTRHSKGGGICIVQSSPTLRNLIVGGNTAYNDADEWSGFQAQGGGLYSSGGSPTLENVVFEGNRAGNPATPNPDWQASYGGAYFEMGTVALTDCVFRGNLAVNYGGGAGFFADGTVTDCLFQNNALSSDVHDPGTGERGISYGGGLSLGDLGIVLDGCVIEGNRAFYGGGLHLADSASSMNIRNTVITGNEVFLYGDGGGLYAEAFSPCDIVFFNLVLADNNADFGAATGNRGGGAYFLCDLAFYNCTITSNEGQAGIALYSAVEDWNPTATLANSIVIEAAGALANLPGGSDLQVSHSLLSEAYPGATNDVGVPGFADPGDPDGADNTWGTLDDGLYPDTTGPAIDAGTNVHPVNEGIELDLAGFKRIGEGQVDRGAYEYNLSFDIAVNTEHGTVVLDPAGGTYAPAITVDLTPSPDPGYTFLGWTGDDVPAGQAMADPLLLFMNNDKEVTASFLDNSLDTDEDGLTDVAEIFTHQSDPENPDTDGDGLGDGVEVSDYGSLPTTDDSDGDGFLDDAEAAAGTSLVEAGDNPDGFAHEYTAIELLFYGRQGSTFRVQYSEGGLGPWIDLGDAMLCAEQYNDYGALEYFWQEYTGSVVGTGRPMHVIFPHLEVPGDSLFMRLVLTD